MDPALNISPPFADISALLREPMQLPPAETPTRSSLSLPRLIRRIILLVAVAALAAFLLFVGMAVIAALIALSLVVWIVRLVTHTRRSGGGRGDVAQDNQGRENVRVIRHQ